MRLVGRTIELQLIEQSVREGRSFALVGASGVGKTTIATAYLEQTAQSTLMLDCFGLNVDEVASTLGRRLDLPATANTAETWVLAAEALADVDVLLLDDVGFDVDVLDALNRAYSGVLLVTCHTPPESMPSLPVSPWDVPDVAELVESPAYELFVRSARSDNIAFDVERHELADVHAVIATLHGHPLGIALAGRQAATTSPAAVARLLDGGDVQDKARPERHRSLDAALEFTWSRLGSDDHRRLFVMALFRRPLRPEALAELCEEPLADVLEGLRRLVRGGLVTRGEFPRAQESFVDVALERFRAEQPERAGELTRRVVARAAELAREISEGLVDHPELGEGPSFWNFVVEQEPEAVSPEEYAAILAAWFRWSALRRAARGDRDTMLRDAERLLSRVDVWDAWFQATRSCLAFPKHAARLLEKTSELARTPRQIHDTAVLSAHVASHLMDHRRALDELERAESHGEPGSLSLVVQADVHGTLGNFARAGQLLDQLEGRDDLTVAAPTVDLLRGWQQKSAGRAIAFLERARDRFRDMGILRSVAQAGLWIAAKKSALLYPVDEVLAELDEAERLAEQLGERFWVLRARMERIGARLQFGQFERALEEAEAFRALPDEHPFAALERLSTVTALWQLGDAEAADVWVDVRRVWQEEIEANYDRAWRVVDVGVALLCADLEQARTRVAGHVEAVPECAPLFEAMLAIGSTVNMTLSELLESWPIVRRAFALAGSEDVGVRQALLYLERNMPPLYERLRTLESRDADIRILHGFDAFLIDQDWVDLSTLDVQRALLKALVEADRPLDYSELGERIYPDEIVTEDSLKNRINVHVAKLRKTRIRPFLLKQREGFVLKGEVIVEDGGSASEAGARD